MIANIPRLLNSVLFTDPAAPWCLDLFCGAGGAGMGYALAGFNVLGVDIKPQPRYPFWFVQGDALEFARQYGGLFDMIHASPVCKRYSSITKTAGTQDTHPDQIDDLREILIGIGKPYVIENVPGAPLKNPLMLCGTMFGVDVIRHRLFECLPPIWFAPAPCRHIKTVVKHGRMPDLRVEYHGISGHFAGIDLARKAMNTDWDTTQDELSQMIPPAYTKYIGDQMMRVLAPNVTNAKKPARRNIKSGQVNI